MKSASPAPDAAQTCSGTCAVRKTIIAEALLEA